MDSSTETEAAACAQNDVASPVANTLAVAAALVPMKPPARGGESRSARLRRQVLAPERQLVAFDLDGTLEDSRGDMVGAIRRVRAVLGID